MKALERYVKKNGKASPFGKTKSKGPWKGPKGVSEKDQYAKESGKKVVDDAEAQEETNPAKGMAKATPNKGMLVKSKPKKKKRPYLEA